MYFTSKEQRERVTNTAKKICGFGICLRGYNCGHSNNAGSSASMRSAVTVCPLAEFNIQPDTRTFFERTPEENSLTMKDLREVCLACPHATSMARYIGQPINWVDFQEACVDCPIQVQKEILRQK